MSEFDDPPTTGGGDNIYTQLFVQRLMLEWRSPDALHVMVALALSFVITRTFGAGGPKLGARLAILAGGSSGDKGEPPFDLHTSEIEKTK